MEGLLSTGPTPSSSDTAQEGLGLFLLVFHKCTSSKHNSLRMVSQTLVSFGISRDLQLELMMGRSGQTVGSQLMCPVTFGWTVV